MVNILDFAGLKVCHNCSALPLQQVKQPQIMCKRGCGCAPVKLCSQNPGAQGFDPWAIIYCPLFQGTRVIPDLRLLARDRISQSPLQQGGTIWSGSHHWIVWELCAHFQDLVVKHCSLLHTFSPFLMGWRDDEQEDLRSYPLKIGEPPSAQIPE